MRFASDAELPDLATAVLRDHIHDAWGLQPLQVGLTALAPVFLLGIAAHYANSRLSLQRDRESAQRKLAGLPEGAS